MAEHDQNPFSEPVSGRQAEPQSPQETGASSGPRIRPQGVDGPPPGFPPQGPGYSQNAYGPGYYPPPGPIAAEPRHLMDHVLTIYRHRWTALSAMAVVFLGVAIYTFTVTPEYEGRAQILIDPDPAIAGFKSPSDQDKRSLEYFQTQITILRSRALARRTIETLKLWDSPEFGAGAVSVVDSVSKAVTGRDGDHGQVTQAAETEAQSRAIDTLLARVVAEPVPETRLIEVRVSSSKATLAAQLTNTLVKAYIDQGVETGTQTTETASTWLGRQLEEQKKKLETSELALQQYREQGNSIALEDRQNIVVQRLTELNAAVTRARTDRIQKEAMYQQMVRLQRDPVAFETFPAIQANSYIQNLKAQRAQLQRTQSQRGEKLGENHPEMIRLVSSIQEIDAQIAVEMEKAVESVRNQYLAAQAQERSLAGELERQKTDALALNRSGIDYSVLRREVESNRAIYDQLLQRAKETGISGSIKATNIRIVDLAEVPRRPERPNRKLHLLYGLLFGAIAGIGLAVFFEYLDNRIKSPDDIKRQLGLPFLGLLPAIAAKDTRGPSPLLSAGVPVSFGEAMRGIRTNVLFSSAETGSRSLVITSTQPGEGKSVVASNLAVSLAQTGKKVLLVDADMRKPRQQEIFGFRSEPGLADAIAGTAKVPEAVIRTSTQNLWLLPAGHLPPNPSELLGSERFRELLDRMREHFDWVLFDAPPVLAVTDVSVIGHLMTGLVFVVGSEQTTIQAAGTAVEQLHASRANIFGVILNKVNVTSNPYYYSHYYKRAYTGYYTAAHRQ